MDTRADWFLRPEELCKGDSELVKKRYLQSLDSSCNIKFLAETLKYVLTTTHSNIFYRALDEKFRL